MDKEEKSKKNRVIVIDQSIEQLANAIVNFLQQDCEDPDPFEEYAREKQAKLYLDLYNFKHRFIHGYEVLLRELSKQEEC